MKSKEHQLSIQRTARYHTLGSLSEKTKTVWFVLHGYGQLANFFIKKFENIANEETFVVAPEGISRFYLDQKYDRVGASWMTKDLRDNEVEEYVSYLNTLYDTIFQDIDNKGITINLLGFSQGCATVSRWLDAGHISCSKLIWWAGFFSNGIGELISPEKLKNIDTYYVYGDNDEFLVAYPEISQRFRDDLVKEVNPKIISFEGKHRVDEQVLLDLVASF